MAIQNSCQHTKYRRHKQKWNERRDIRENEIDHRRTHTHNDDDIDEDVGGEWRMASSVSSKRWFINALIVCLLFSFFSILSNDKATAFDFVWFIFVFFIFFVLFFLVFGKLKALIRSVSHSIVQRCQPKWDLLLFDSSVSTQLPSSAIPFIAVTMMMAAIISWAYFALMWAERGTHHTHTLTGWYFKLEWSKTKLCHLLKTFTSCLHSHEVGRSAVASTTFHSLFVN